MFFFGFGLWTVLGYSVERWRHKNFQPRTTTTFRDGVLQYLTPAKPALYEYALAQQNKVRNIMYSKTKTLNMHIYCYVGNCVTTNNVPLPCFSMEDKYLV